MAAEERGCFEDWIEFETAALRNPQTYEAPVGYSSETVFDLVDEDRDGVIYQEEYARFFKGFLLGEEEGRGAFARLNINGDGRPTRGEVFQTVRDLHTNSDPTSPSNWLSSEF